MSSNLSELQQRRLRFWTSFINNHAHKLRIQTSQKPSVEDWLSVSAGRAGLKFGFTVKKDSVLVNFLNRLPEPQYSKVFQHLLANKAVIENKLGRPLEFDPMEGTQRSMVRDRINGQGLDAENEWDSLQAKMADRLNGMIETLTPYIEEALGQ